MGDSNTAKNYYQKAIKINSYYAPALTNLGSIELNTGNKQEGFKVQED
ncbi:MAG: tetratricopeptide repeat protein [Prochlorococcus marinus]